MVCGGVVPVQNGMGKGDSKKMEAREGFCSLGPVDVWFGIVSLGPVGVGRWLDVSPLPLQSYQYHPGNEVYLTCEIPILSTGVWWGISKSNWSTRVSIYGCQEDFDKEVLHESDVDSNIIHDTFANVLFR